MFRKTELARCALVALGALAALPAAQAQDTQLERVEITGSSIRRIDAEGSLPVQVIRREEISKTGATSVTDLLQKLPAIQGGTGEGASVGGGGAGFSGVSIHNIGESRTLVLLNGRRLANFGGQSLTGSNAAMDLNNIPIAAVERVEILTDGASALYGSDAIAGVVNFITRQNSTLGDISVGVSRPKGGVADEKRVSVTKGFGDLEEQGFNILFSAGYDKRDPMNAPDRNFSRSGVINFSHKGRRYQAFQGSASPIPANVSIGDNTQTTDDDRFFNPYYAANGNCAPSSVAVATGGGDTACYFDFVQQLETYPERERWNGILNASMKVGDNHTIFFNSLYAKTQSTGIIAPVPGQISVEAGSDLHNTYLAPLGVTGDAIAFYRVADLGKRIDYNDARFKNFVLGADGTVANWDYKAGVTRSENKYTNDISGYPGALALRGLTRSGLLNPFVLPGEQTPEAQEALAGTAYKGNWDGGISKLTTFDISGSRPLMELPGGPLAIGVGASYQIEKFESRPSLFAQGRLADPVTGAICDPEVTDPDSDLACDQRFGDGAETTPYGGERKIYGAFLELNAPVTKQLELNGAIRFDHYDDVGNTTNGKAGFRWIPSQGVLIRGSVGTGFKAPTVSQINGQRQPFGVTGGDYDRSAALQAIADSLGAQLRPDGQQYDVIATGNRDLKPEKSKQASIGFVLEPTSSVSLGADLWYVAIRDALGQQTEQAVFADPAAFPNSWTTARDVGTGVTYLAWLADNQNLGKSYASGVDFNLQGRLRTDVGNLTSQLVATYMLREDQQVIKDGPYYSAIGVNSPDLGVVTFRWQGRLTTALNVGNWTHTLQANFKSGYEDAEAEVELLGPGDTPTGEFEVIKRRVGTYVSFDWQTQWQAMKNLSLTGGVLNLFDRDPPLSLASGGTGKGQMFGYDDRYYDARGRTLYLNASLAF